MNFVNFRFETDSDGIALLTWDMPGRSMNVITPEVIGEIEAVVDHVAAEASIKGCVITSGKDNFSGGADLSMLQSVACRISKGAAGERRRGSHKTLFRARKPPLAGLSQARNLRQTFRHCDQWHLCGRRLRARARLPLPGHRG